MDLHVSCDPPPPPKQKKTRKKGGWCVKTDLYSRTVALTQGRVSVPTCTVQSLDIILIISQSGWGVGGAEGSVFPPVTHHAVFQSEAFLTLIALKWPLTCNSSKVSHWVMEKTRPAYHSAWTNLLLQTLISCTHIHTSQYKCMCKLIIW